MFEERSRVEMPFTAKRGQNVFLYCGEGTLFTAYNLNYQSLNTEAILIEAIYVEVEYD